jgi:hypothetical protein
MSMRAIEARFTGKPVKLDDTEEGRVLTALKMIYGRTSAGRDARVQKTA